MKHAERPFWTKFAVFGIVFSFLLCPRPALALCGDVGGDGSILSNDVLMVARASIGTLTLTAGQKARADVVVSGTPDGLIMSNDVLMIARASLGMITLSCTETPAQKPQQPTTAGSYYTMLEISWTAYTSQGVVGYNVYVNSAKVNDEIVTGTTFSFGGLAAGGSYNVQVQAVLALGGESALSDSAVAATLAVSGNSGVVAGRVLMPQSGGAARLLSRAALAIPAGYIPATGTTVTLKDTSYQTTTDNGGWFELAGVAPATYELDAVKGNFKAVVSNVHATAGQVTNIGDVTVTAIVAVMSGTETVSSPEYNCDIPNPPYPPTHVHLDAVSVTWAVSEAPRRTWSWTVGQIPDISGVWDTTSTVVSCVNCALYGLNLGYQSTYTITYSQNGSNVTWDDANYEGEGVSCHDTGTINNQGLFTYSGQCSGAFTPYPSCPPISDSGSGSQQIVR